MSRGIANQKKVYDKYGTHVGTYNYDSSGNMVDRDWVVDGKWSTYDPVANENIAGHTVDPHYVDKSANNNFGNGPITQSQAQSIVDEYKRNTYDTDAGSQHIYNDANKEAYERLYGANDYRGQSTLLNGPVVDKANAKAGDVIDRKTLADGRISYRVYTPGGGIFGTDYVPGIYEPAGFGLKPSTPTPRPTPTPSSGGGGGIGNPGNPSQPTNPGSGTSVNVNDNAVVDNSTTGTIGNDNVFGDNLQFNNNNAVTNIDQAFEAGFVGDREFGAGYDIDIKRNAEVDNSVNTTIGDRNVFGDNAYIGNNDSVTNIDQSTSLMFDGRDSSMYRNGANRGLARTRSGNWLSTKSPLQYF